MATTNRLLDCYLPPQDGFILESLVATTYQIDFEFLEEDLLARALGVRSPVSRMAAFRSELERRLQRRDVSILYDLAGCERLARLSPRIDPIPIAAGKLHAKVAVQMWVRPEPDPTRVPDRRLRLVVGSANLTRQGFRENYECVTALDYGGRDSAAPVILHAALAFLRDLAADSASDQLTRQLDEFERTARSLPYPEADRGEGPDRFVRGEEVVPTLQDQWRAISMKAPTAIQIVSPFWPEGASAAEALASLLNTWGIPETLELICRGAQATDGRTWLPEFTASTARDLRQQVGCRVFLRPAVPDHGVEPDERPDAGDETEDAQFDRVLRPARSVPGSVQRALHAKLIVLSGPEGAVLYVGSSNCTRRGLALGGPKNLEAGLVYRYGPRRSPVSALLAFAGEPVEVLPDQLPPTQSPERVALSPVPRFLVEVAAKGTLVTSRFRSGESVPEDLRILMQDPAIQDSPRYWMLYRAADDDAPAEHAADLRSCPRCDRDEVPTEDQPGRVVPHVQVEVRWDGIRALFPVRFADKKELPLLHLGRKPSEGELIEYFLFGREPNENGGGEGGENGETPAGVDDALDTRRILSYFVRRFVQAVPGMEAEVERAAYSRRALEMTLGGPTSPRALAQHAFDSLTRPPGPYEPAKTVTAVGFQLVEIIAALSRCRDKVPDPELRDCFAPVLGHCRDLLDALTAEHAELRQPGFQQYRSLFTEGAA